MSRTGVIVKSFLCASIAAAFSMPRAAHAATVFQSVADLNDLSNIATFGACSSCGDPSIRVFDQFTITNTQSINGFSVSLYGADNFWPVFIDFSIWTVLPGDRVGSELFSQGFGMSAIHTEPIPGSVMPPLLIASTDDVTGLTLDPGTYYVSFYDPIALGVNTYNTSGGHFYQQGSEARSDTMSVGFTLTSADEDVNKVPEPGSSALAILALLGIAASRRVLSNC